MIRLSNIILQERTVVVVAVGDTSGAYRQQRRIVSFAGAGGCGNG